ncbi:MAG TPA: YfhO family protein [Conexibacter sp.]|nr:YfhO family protein [Conexibacter sp.]
MGRGTQTRPRDGIRMPSALVEHPTLSAALLFALLVLVYLWPVLLGAKVFSPDAVLYKVPPWQSLQPHDVASFENYLLADVPLVVRPWHELMRELLRTGTFPAWDPHVLTGIPLISNPQTGLFSPFSLPLWVLPFTYAFGVVAALKLWAAAFGTYLLARELRLGFLPGLLAGIAFGFCSMNIMWLMPEAVPAVVVMLPWMLWLVERLARGSGGIGSAIGLACVTAAALGGGHPGTQVHVLVAAGVYALLRAAFARERAPPERLKTLGLTLGSLVVGIGLIAVLLIPEIVSSHGTVGTLARRSGHGEYSLPGLDRMPFGMIRTPLFPDWWGRPSGLETADSPLHSINLNYEERTFYAGVVALLLAAIGLTNRAALRRQAPFLILGGLGLAIALHAPGLWWLVTHLPALQLVENQRLHFVFELAIAVLAAFGLQAVLERPQERGRQLAVALAGIGVALIAAALAHVGPGDVGHTVEHFLTGRDFHRRGVIELTTIAWFLLFTLGVTAALLALRRRPGWATAVATTLVLLAALDMLHFANRYNPMAPGDRVTPPRTPAIAYLQEHRAEGRFVGVELALPPEQSIRFGLADVRGYNPPFPTKDFLALWREATPGQVAWLPTTIGGITPATVQVTGALGARFILAAPGTTPPTAPDPALEPLRRVYSGRDATIFENPRATPRAFVAPAIVSVPDAASARAALVDSGFDARRAVVVESDQPSEAGLAGAQGARGTAAIVAERNAHVTLRATLDRRGIVVLGDQLLDGWSVQVDGHPTTPVRVDAVLRGVVVDAGQHEIVWSYRVPGLRAGIATSALALILLLGAALLPRARRARARRTRERS